MAILSRILRSRLGRSAGRAAYWFGLPALWLVLNGTTRTRVLVVIGSELLVVRPWMGDGTWLLPGGGAHRGEDAAVAAARELCEETGLEVAPDQLLPLGSEPHRHRRLRYRSIYFVCQLSSTPVVTARLPEILDCCFMPITRLSTGVSPELRQGLKLLENAHRSRTN